MIDSAGYGMPLTARELDLLEAQRHFGPTNENGYAYRSSSLRYASPLLWLVSLSAFVISFVAIVGWFGWRALRSDSVDVVAAQNLPAGTELTATLLRSRSGGLDGIGERVDEIVGMVLTTPVHAGSLIDDGVLGPPLSELKPGTRVVSVGLALRALPLEVELGATVELWSNDQAACSGSVRSLSRFAGDERAQIDIALHSQSARCPLSDELVAVVISR